MAHPITIVGSGIAGLTIGRVLRRHGIPVQLYNRTKPGTRFGYSIALHQRSYESLLQLLNLDLSQFSAGVGVGGCFNAVESSKTFRVHRARLDELLAQDLGIHEKDVTGASITNDGVVLKFGDGSEVTARRVIVADGALSTVRNALLPHVKPTVHPFVVINGKCKFQDPDSSHLLPHFPSDTAMLEHRSHDVLLQTYINDLDIEKNECSISFTYSRPARKSDPLFTPHRSTSDARRIPQEFYDELRSLRPLPEPFNLIFSEENVKSSNLLSWLMRSVLIPKSDLLQLAKKEVWVLGDAAHATPILGSSGANDAILDAIQLGGRIAGDEEAEVLNFYGNVFESWKTTVEGSEKRLQELHSSGVSAAL
ncbi:MAG: hypothetical protein Q9159_002678 [Coniocarpon cinnabarinum]